MKASLTGSARRFILSAASSELPYARPLAARAIPKFLISENQKPCYAAKIASALPASPAGGMRTCWTLVGAKNLQDGEISFFPLASL
jgi:hypothetical protein